MRMTTVTMTMELTPDIEKKARELGILTGEHLAALIAAEVEQQSQKNTRPVPPHIEQILREVLAPERVEEALRMYAEGKAIPGLHARDAVPIDDEALFSPLPDEIWGDLFK
jgi:hypothetical protein